jgi:hypothetical protein
MPVRAVTPLVQPHHIVIVPRADSDHQNYDAARDELAVPDPYELEWEPVYTHGPVKAPELAGSFPATPASTSSPTGRNPVDARAAWSPPSGCAGSRATIKS